VYGTGYPPAQIDLAGGTAWLPTPAQGLVTLVDGPSELVVGSVRTPVRDDAEVLQVGSSALLVDPGAGTVRRVDGATYAVSDAVRFATGGGLSVLAGRTVAYVVDTARRTAASLDPATMHAGPDIPLSAAPGPGQAVVDDRERLWVVDGGGGGLSGFADGRSPVRSAGVGPSAQLVTVQGAAAVVDPTRRQAGLVGDDGEVARWGCFDPPDAAGLRLLGSATSPRLYAAVPQTGALLVADLSTGACPASVPVGAPGDRFGPLVESNGFVLVPDETTGKLAAVDVTARAVRDQLTVLPAPTGQLELVAKDGVVFYNDLAGDRAGVIRFNGAWSVGPVTAKYRAADGQPDTVLAAGTGDIPQGAAPVAPPPRAAAVAPPPPPPAPPTAPVVGGAPALAASGTLPPTVPPTAPTSPAGTVVVPDFSSVLNDEYDQVIFYIKDKISTACGDGTQCLKPVASAADRGPSDPGATPCVITKVPAGGRAVPRGSTITFTIDHPCDAGTATTTTARTTTDDTTTTTAPPTSKKSKPPRTTPTAIPTPDATDPVGSGG
jgi:hypothetical protein